MLTDIGEYIVGAYLQLRLDCDVVDYNVRPPGGGLPGLEELDVVGLNLKTRTAYLCEVTTHIRGLQYGAQRETMERVRKKYHRQEQYGAKYLSDFSRQHMFWSPVVPTGFLTEPIRTFRSAMRDQRRIQASNRGTSSPRGQYNPRCA